MAAALIFGLSTSQLFTLAAALSAIMFPASLAEMPPLPYRSMMWSATFCPGVAPSLLFSSFCPAYGSWLKR
eukprot:1714593-Amphidinium_carterae.1